MPEQPDFPIKNNKSAARKQLWLPTLTTDLFPLLPRIRLPFSLSVRVCVCLGIWNLISCQALQVPGLGLFGTCDGSVWLDSYLCSCVWNLLFQVNATWWIIWLCTAKALISVLLCFEMRYPWLVFLSSFTWRRGCALAHRNWWLKGIKHSLILFS